MSRRFSKSTLREISEINMTPLMDLTFILLITFIITFPLIEQGIPVNLPHGEAADLDQELTRTISLDIEGDLYLDDHPVTVEELAREMNTLGRADPGVIVLVRADEEISYGRVAEIMRILHEAQIVRMGLVTQPETGR